MVYAQVYGHVCIPTLCSCGTLLTGTLMVALCSLVCEGLLWMLVFSLKTLLWRGWPHSPRVFIQYFYYSNPSFWFSTINCVKTNFGSLMRDLTRMPKISHRSLQHFILLDFQQICCCICRWVSTSAILTGLFMAAEILCCRELGV